MKRLIAFTGGMGVGKSTAISVLKDNPILAEGYPVSLVKFAAPIYDIQEYVYNRISAVYSRPKDFIKDRKLLQWIGTEFGRGISEKLWVDIWANESLALLRDNHIVLCDDVRFDNEADAVHALGGVVVKISRQDNQKHAGGGTGIVAHSSEAGIDPKKIDFEVFNSGTLPEFKDSLTYLYKRFRRDGIDNY